MRILLVGMNHRTAPLELRERLAVDDPAAPLQKLVAETEIDEAVLFSTCNRVELVVVTRSVEAARLCLRGFFARELGARSGIDDMSQYLYEYLDGDAMRHVLRVASSLDSMVVGEPQILGQTKDAFQRANECKAAGPLLGRLFQHAFATAKRVRTETGIAERPVSVARVAVDLARQIFEELGDKRAVLVGAGEMIEMALGALRGAGLRSVSVVNRTPERALELAARFGATAHALDELAALVAEADVILSCIGGERPILTVPLVQQARRGRHRQPLFVIDIGVPRNADPELDSLDDVYLYDIDDLSSLARENAEQRQRESARAEAIVEEERQRFDGWLMALRAVPTIKHLRERAESIRSAELERALRRPSLKGVDPEALDQLTRSMVNKILHAPVSRLRREAEREEGMAYLEAARVLFGLDDDSPAEDE
ncbi:MAG: glutamyl-tRNA reductase [Deltaproteobacteria bacterium]|nr:glutamyl-tRNA reductase [Deltaproteobacteria bacterium]